MRIKEEEKRIIILVAKGLNNYQIAEKMNYSYGTVKKTIQRLFKQYRVNTRASLVFEFLKPKLVDIGFWDECGKYVEDFQMVTSEEM